MDRVLLLNMPFHAVQYPSIGLSLLKAELEREGIPCDILYLNLAFAEQLCTTRADVPSIIGTFKAHGDLVGRFLLLGDWIFSHDLYPERTGENRSLEEVLTMCHQYWMKPWVTLDAEVADFAGEVAHARTQVTPFLDNCLDSIDWEQYAVIGFSSVFHQQVASLALAKRIKARYPGKTLVFGGANCEGPMGEALHRLCPFVDVVCSGKADWTFPELVKRVLGKEPLEDIPDIVYRRDGESCSTIGRPAPRVDLDSLPYPDYSDYVRQLQQNRIAPLVGPWLLFETSRGCWWGQKSRCTFCGLNGTTLSYSSKSPQRAVDELAYLSSAYGMRTFVAVDNVLDMAYFQSFIPELARRKLDVSIHYETRANLSKERVRQLKEAGVIEIRPGIETLSTPILELMRKGTTALQNVQLLKWAREAGIWVGWTFMLGLPGEDPEEYSRMAEAVRAISHLQAPLDCSFVRLDRFSPYFVDPEAYGMCNVRPLEIYRYIYPVDEADLYQLAYFFDYDHADGRNPVGYVLPLVNAVDQWKQKGSARLSYATQGDELLICDERNEGSPRRLALRGARKEVYEFCDQARRYAAIESHASEIHNGLNRDELARFLDSLVDLRLMLREGDAYLSLATRATPSGVA